MLWRISANHTHLYPGALLRHLDAAHGAAWSPGDDVQVEFSDGMTAFGRLIEAEPNVVVLEVSAYRTRRGMDVVERI